MAVGVVLFTLGIYGLAGWLYWRDGSINYLIALAAGHLASLPSPLWQLLYRFSYDPAMGALYTALDRSLPWAIFLGAWMIMLPPLAVFHLYRLRWWSPSYSSALLTFAVFVLYFLLIETIGQRAGWWRYSQLSAPPLGMSMTLLAGLMNGLVALGALSALILTRRYAWLSLLTVLLPAPLVLSIFVHGLLGAPFYTVVLLQGNQLLSVESWAAAIGLLGTMGLLFAAAHTVASVLAGQRGVRHSP